nr:NUT family member 2D-like [Macaca nemestrina]
MAPSEGLDSPPEALPPIPALGCCLVLGKGGLDTLSTAWASFTPRFLEFEAEEEMQIQKSQLMKGPQCLPPPAPPRLEPQGLPAPEADKQPVYLPSKAGPKAPTAGLPPPRAQRPVETKARLPPCRPHRRAETKAHLPPRRPQRPAETKVPEEIPPEVVQEYVDIMEELLGPPLGATGEPEKQREEGEVKQPQEEDWTPPDPGLLSYIDKLCSQKDFVTKVEAVIHPRFLEELLSPHPQMDFSALSQELEQEEGLTLAQLVEKRLLPLKEKEHARAAPSHGMAWLDSSSSKFAAGQGAERDVPDPQQGVGMETFVLENALRAAASVLGAVLLRGGEPLQLLQGLTDAEEALIPPTTHSQGLPALARLLGTSLHYQYPRKILGLERAGWLLFCSVGALPLCRS